MPEDIEAPEKHEPYVPKPDGVALCKQEFEAMLVATDKAIAEHWLQRRSSRVRLRRRVQWWAFRLGFRPLGPRGDFWYAVIPEIKLRQILTLPFFGQLAVAMVVPDLVIREELVIWLNKKQPCAKRISVEIDDWLGRWLRR